MESKALSLLLFFTSILSAFGTNPGIVVRVNQESLDYALQIALQVFAGKLNFSINDLYEETVTPFGYLKYELKNFSLTDTSMGKWSFNTVQDVGLRVSISKVNFELSTDWMYDLATTWHLKDSGSLRACLNDMSFSLTLRIGAEKGKPTISTASCSDKFGSVKVHFTGPKSWLYNMFAKRVIRAVTPILRNRICKIVSHTVNEKFKEILANLTVRVKVNEHFLFDYSFTGPPLFKENHMNVKLKGEVLSASHPNESSLIPAVVPESEPCSKMICAYLTDYFLDTASQAIYDENLLNITINGSQVPPMFGLNCTTKLLLILGLERVYNEFPDFPLLVNLNLAKAPTFVHKRSGVSIAADAYINLYVITEENRPAFLFSVIASLNLDGHLRLHETVLYGSVSEMSLLFGAIKSNVGNIKPNIGIVNLVFNLTKDLIIEEINAFGERGYPLPIPELPVQFKNMDLGYGKVLGKLAKRLLGVIAPKILVTSHLALSHPSKTGFFSINTDFVINGTAAYFQ